MRKFAGLIVYEGMGLSVRTVHARTGRCDQGVFKTVAACVFFNQRFQIVLLADIDDWKGASSYQKYISQCRTMLMASSNALHGMDGPEPAMGFFWGGGLGNHGDSELTLLLP